MSTVSYKNQPAIHKTGAHSNALAWSKHVYTVSKVLWPEEVEEFLSTLLLPRSLHVCCGKSKLGDVRFDNDPNNKPDHVGDAAQIASIFGAGQFESILCDPPYNGKFQWNHDLLCGLSVVAQKRIIFQHWFIPVDHLGRWKKWHKFTLTAAYIWQPRTYFGRAQVISVFDAI